MLTEILFPKTCYGCSKANYYICEPCRLKTKIPEPICPHCSLRLPGGKLQPRCSKKLSLERIFLCANYKDKTISRIIWDLKYKNCFVLADDIANLAVNWIKENQLSRDLIKEGVIVAPIPSHKKRILKRGFNPTEKIARRFCRSLGLKLENEILIKTKNSPYQAKEKSAEQRRANVQGAYKAQGKQLYKNQNCFVDRRRLYNRVYNASVR